MKWIPTAILVLASSYIGFSQSRPVEMFKSEVVNLGGLTNVLQITPWPTNEWKFFTNPAVGQMKVSGTLSLDSYVGTVMRLSWDSVTNVMYEIEQSTNQTTWVKIPIRFEGNGKNRIWYSTATNDYFRLNKLFVPPTVPKPPSNLRKLTALKLEGAQS